MWTGVKSLLSLHQPSDATGQLAEAVDRRLFLHALDAAVAKLRLRYVPFIDDILILAPTRWQLPGSEIDNGFDRRAGALGIVRHRRRGLKKMRPGLRPGPER